MRQLRMKGLRIDRLRKALANRGYRIVFEPVSAKRRETLTSEDAKRVTAVLSAWDDQIDVEIRDVEDETELAVGGCAHCACQSCYDKYHKE